MKTIVPTSCIAVAGQSLRQWRKLYRNKIKMFGKSWTEHVYEFTPVGLSWSETDLKSYKKSDPYIIRVYKNEAGFLIWAIEEGESPFHHNDRSPEINKSNILDFPGTSHFANQWQKTSYISWKKEWKRSYSDVRFLLSFERTKEDFVKKVTEHRSKWLLFSSLDVEGAVWQAVELAESGNSRPRIGAYSGPASLSIQELKTLGVKVCHRPPTKKFPQVAPSDHVVENFNWGARTPKKAEWFRYGAGYSYHGTVGCNSGWVWYD